jgi:hypothetical protein
MKEISFFTGEIKGKLAIEEWFKIAERITTNAGWTNEQNYVFFKKTFLEKKRSFVELVVLVTFLTFLRKVN